MHDQILGHLSFIAANFAALSLVLAIVKVSNISRLPAINAWHPAKIYAGKKHR